ncbi:MAG: hypothetical protein FWC64_07165 [Treponema sp.]|nr:hypothetical protein [Treponema sp.]
MSLQPFRGDILLYDTPDGGDINITEGLIESDSAFNTAVYLSLFGGNKDDNGRIKNRKTWWGNILRGVNENQRLVSRFQAIVFGLPMTTKNILNAEEAARLDLAWVIGEKIADEILTDGRAITHNRFNLQVKINAKGQTIYDNAFAIYWRAANAI